MLLENYTKIFFTFYILLVQFPLKFNGRRYRRRFPRYFVAWPMCYTASGLHRPKIFKMQCPEKLKPPKTKASKEKFFIVV